MTPARARRTLAPACALVAALGLGLPASGGEAPPLRVFAAASLTEVVQALAADFDGAPVQASFGASSRLARQIRDGAPADLFLSASPAWVDFLVEHGRVDGPPRPLARNRLVAVASPSGPLADARIAGPETLAARLAPGLRLGIASEGVPAGEYARAALRHHGLLEALRPRLVGQRDVRAVLHAVERGSLAAGFVYATDAREAGLPVLFVFDEAAHPPIAYRAALLRDAARPLEARRFLSYLRGEAARRIFAEAGFARP